MELDLSEEGERIPTVVKRHASLLLGCHTIQGNLHIRADQLVDVGHVSYGLAGDCVSYGSIVAVCLVLVHHTHITYRIGRSEGSELVNLDEFTLELILVVVSGVTVVDDGLFPAERLRDARPVLGQAAIGIVVHLRAPRNRVVSRLHSSALFGASEFRALGDCLEVRVVAHVGGYILGGKIG